jgi:hypothetical protein
MILRAFQQNGASRSNLEEGWRLFSIDKIVDLKVCSKVFVPESFEGYREGDKGMNTIYAQVYF